VRPNQRHRGIAIALAWPQTFCKEPGSWYDPVTRWLGINRNNYYRAGHAALVLVDGKNKTCHYFDFGRYHAPFKHGRVRSAETDHDLRIQTTPKISGDGKLLLNFYEILEELQHNPACHGEGALYASYCPVDFISAKKKALGMQSDSPIPYGPFIPGGSNCSRFVNAVILSGKPDWYNKISLKYFIPFTPTPLNNVHSLPNRIKVPVLRKTLPFTPVRPLTRSELISTLPRPARHPAIPENAQWLSGEGAGSWFAFEFEGTFPKVTRFSPDGTIECIGKYEGPAEVLQEMKNSIVLDYLSNCKEINLRINGKRLKFSIIHTCSSNDSFIPKITSQTSPVPILQSHS
jgi:hypothetical protein